MDEREKHKEKVTTLINVIAELSLIMVDSIESVKHEMEYERYDTKDTTSIETINVLASAIIIIIEEIQSHLFKINFINHKLANQKPE